MRLKGIIFVLLGACSYGVLSTIVVLAYRAGFTLNDVIGSQTVLGAALLWIVVAIQRSRGNQTGAKLTKQQTLLMLITGTTTGLTGLLYYASLQYLSPALGVVLFLQFTWMGIVLESVANRQWPKMIQLVSLVFILVGTVLATGLLNTTQVTFHWLGVILGLFAALSNAIRIFVSGRLAVKTDPMLRSAVMVTGGAILTSVVVPPFFLFSIAAFSELFFSYGFPLAFFGSFFGMWMFAKGAPLVGSGVATILSSMQLPMTILLSIVVLHLQIESIQLFGVLVILLGVATTEIKFGKSTNTIN